MNHSEIRPYPVSMLQYHLMSLHVGSSCAKIGAELSSKRGVDTPSNVL